MIQYRSGQVTVFQSAVYKTTSTVIVTDDLVLIADPNWLPREIEEIRQHVEAVRGGRPVYVLFTHGDFDHIIGYRAFPGAVTIGSKGLLNHPEKEKKLALITSFDAGHYIDRDYPVEFPHIDIAAAGNGQVFQLGETSLTFYLAPGHTPDGLMTVVEPPGVLIAGDYLSDFELPFIYDSAKAYEGTLDTVRHIYRTHVLKLLVPGHGQATGDVREMERRLELADHYLQSLIAAVQADDGDALLALRDAHAYRSAFTDGCHDENVRIIRSEYAGR
ncbi:MBL fold metallo-hydrolase [Paenibacillus sp. 1P03SA]|uniref:MBL fold metallo-hydrolase n=1 Tax=Paenibacillus sp. 1P03SA TaxID=3132294 RepID=UPI0039A266F9